jgi:hypothetical protein
MKTWFVPPVVIPIAFLMALVIVATVKWGI